MFINARINLLAMHLGIILCYSSFGQSPQTEKVPAVPSTASLARTDCANPESGWKIEKLNGKVKLLREYEVEMRYGSRKKELTRVITFHPNGDYRSVDDRWVYSRKDYSLTKAPTFVFDQECRVIEKRSPKLPWLMADGDRTVFSYSPSGTVKETTKFDLEGRLLWKSVSTLDDNERIIEVDETIQEHPEHFNPKRYDMYRFTKSLFKLDGSGNRIEEISYDWKGNLYATYKLGYDATGRLIRKLRLDSKNRPIDLTIYKFDSVGSLLEELKYSSSSYSGIDELIPETLDSGFGLFQDGEKIKYEYDRFNNWNKKTAFDLSKNGKLNSVTSRMLSYY